jgi:hypothetical protein
MGLTKAERADAAVSSFDPSESVSFGGGTENGSATHPLILQMNAARKRLDERLVLLTWALDLHDCVDRFDLALLLDTCEIRRQVSALKARRRQAEARR